MGQNDPIAVFTKVAAFAVANDEDERRRRGGGNAPSSGSNCLNSGMHPYRNELNHMGQTVACRTATTAISSAPAWREMVSCGFRIKHLLSGIVT
jgi:hypothetical protein